jgi:hypothetical protein
MATESRNSHQRSSQAFSQALRSPSLLPASLTRPAIAKAKGLSRQHHPRWVSEVILRCLRADARSSRQGAIQTRPRRSLFGVKFGDDAVTRYWNVTVAMARLTLSGGQKVTGPGTAPGVAILVPWPGWLRICSPAAFDTLTAPSIRNTPSA